ncbi:hypothetical protein KQX54_021050 [Cotesia glomerata]|uniref:Uncharacterized protein n=1 Tax=Cotesia glomerata TaxID=32391 RepID=A0AAV7I2J8_COTGL|nr:hypothetical protein KQX54_021050 [Cotesia glomerata]
MDSTMCPILMSDMLQRTAMMMMMMMIIMIIRALVLLAGSSIHTSEQERSRAIIIASTIARRDKSSVLTTCDAVVTSVTNRLASVSLSFSLTFVIIVYLWLFMLFYSAMLFWRGKHRTLSAKPINEKTFMKTVSMIIKLHDCYILFDDDANKSTCLQTAYFLIAITIRVPIGDLNRHKDTEIEIGSSLIENPVDKSSIKRFRL